MGLLFRSVVVIGAIALYSPVHDGRPDPTSLRQEAARLGGTALAAKDAVEAFAALDPETQKTLTALALTGLERSYAGARDAGEVSSTQRRP